MYVGACGCGTDSWHPEDESGDLVIGSRPDLYTVSSSLVPRLFPGFLSLGVRQVRWEGGGAGNKAVGVWGISVIWINMTCFAHSHLQIYTSQIAESLPDKPKLARGEVEQYLKVLVDDQVRGW